MRVLKVSLFSFFSELWVRGEELLIWNRFIGVKFKVEYDSVPKMEAGQVTELPGQVPMYGFLPKEILQYMIAVHGLWFEEGVYDLKPKRFLNEKFPEIRPIKVKELLEVAWKKV